MHASVLFITALAAFGTAELVFAPYNTPAASMGSASGTANYNCPDSDPACMPVCLDVKPPPSCGQTQFLDSVWSQGKNGGGATWHWSCYDCPTGYYGLYDGACGNLVFSDSQCVTCNGTGETLTLSSVNDWRCITSCTPSSTSCGFYQCLDANYDSCYTTGYPLKVGYPNCQNYATNSSQFSAQGQQWISNMNLCLQQALVNDAVNPNETCAQLNSTAFASHPSCYIKNGVCSLTKADWTTSFKLVGAAFFSANWAAWKKALQANKGCVKYQKFLQTSLKK